MLRSKGMYLHTGRVLSFTFQTSGVMVKSPITLACSPRCVLDEGNRRWTEPSRAIQHSGTTIHVPCALLDTSSSEVVPTNRRGHFLFLK
jgi:hypothetical protein